MAMYCFQYEKCLQLCMKSEDEMFHISLYGWMIDQKLEETLLQVRNSHVP